MRATKTRVKAKPEFPMTITVKGVPGITTTIYKQERTKPDKDGRPQKYLSFIVSYSLSGKRKMEAHSDLADARAAAAEAIHKIDEGRQSILELSNRDREQYQRAKETLDPLAVDLDIAAREYADARTILNGTGTLAEAARFYLKAHAKELPRITVPAAVEKCLAQARADGKSRVRLHELEHYLNAFAKVMNVQLSEVTPGIVSRYLTAMTTSERTKKNARDIIGYLGRWCVLQGYLERGTDLVEGVQRYSMKPGTIQIFTPAEISRLIENADAKLLPYLVIGAFAGLRGAEILRLDWSEIDLQDGFIEVKAEKAKTEVRRLVPVKPNLAEWLGPYQKKSGPVCSLKSIWNRFVELVSTINKQLPKGSPDSARMKWKKNALRHSYISYRVAECADVARVADESGNSPAIIRSNYLRRVKPTQAKEWFNVMPAVAEVVEKVVQMPVLA